MSFKIVYMDRHRMIKLKPWDYEANVTEPGYHAGLFPPHYPVPCVYVSSANPLWHDEDRLVGQIGYFCLCA